MVDTVEPVRETPRTWRRTWQRSSPWAGLVLGLALWWPAGFWGTGAWPRLPLDVLSGDVLVLGAAAAAAAVGLVVRRFSLRLLVVVVAGVVAWALGGPSGDAYPDAREVLVLLLVGGGLLGLLLGARAMKGAVPAATVLAVVAALSPASWPHGPLLALALALPSAVATWKGSGVLLWRVARILATWLVLALGARAVTYGWDILHPGMAAGSKRQELRLVVEAGWDFVRTQWQVFSRIQLEQMVPWFWVAGALGLVLVLVRAMRARRGQVR